MADQCIVCLGDLRTAIAADTQPDAAAGQAPERSGDEGVQKPQPSLRNTKLSIKSIDDDEEIIAHLLPCKHDLHNACLKPWVERANSCPICRATFKQVDLSKVVGGEVIDSYAVKDKVQEAEIDPSMIIEEDELFAAETWEPCIICSEIDEAHEQMWCDGCGKAVHIFCAGFEEGPDVWYCETCLVDIENDTSLPGLHEALRRPPRRRAPPVRRMETGALATGGRRQDTSWARVWQEVSRRLDLDLDFPFDDDDDDPTRDTRTPQQRREFKRWQERFNAADRQSIPTGTASRLRELGTRLQNHESSAAQPESQEELRAWNAFDKARELTDVSASRRKRKATASPASPQEPEPEQPKLKRPRLRRPAASAASAASPPAAESSHAAAQRAGEPSNFLSSLLREVANRPGSDGSPAGSDQMSGGQYSPRNSSPARSPTSSGYASPRAGSTSPPPRPPNSPRLTAPDSPPFSPEQMYSPFSPTVYSADVGRTPNPAPTVRPRGRRRDHHPAHDSGYDETSPSRAMSYSSKEEIQRMVKLSLGPRYRDKTITKDQYTDINRDVSRRLYDMVGDASALTNGSAREKWQGVADEEVRKAIERIGKTVACDGKGV